MVTSLVLIGLSRSVLPCLPPWPGRWGRARGLAPVVDVGSGLPGNPARQLLLLKATTERAKSASLRGVWSNATRLPTERAGDELVCRRGLNHPLLPAWSRIHERCRTRLVLSGWPGTRFSLQDWFVGEDSPGLPLQEVLSASLGEGVGGQCGPRRRAQAAAGFMVGVLMPAWLLLIEL